MEERIFGDHDFESIFEDGDEDGDMLEKKMGESSSEKMYKFFFIFGEDHLHPETEEKMENYWVEIEATSYKEAYIKMVESLYGMRWRTQYWDHEFESVKSKLDLSGGCYERNPTKISNPLERYMFPNIEDL